MADKMKMNKQPASPLFLPVAVEKTKKQARAAPPLPAVRLVSLWALYNAGVIAFAVVMAFTLCAFDIFSQLPSWLFQDVELTDAGSALTLGYTWCSVPQAAAATLALLLAGHRRRTRRALAYLALACAVAEHCMFAGVVRIILAAADPGYLVMWVGGPAVVLLFALGDLVGFLALLSGGE